MATRYSGSLIIRAIYVEKTQAYDCRVSTPEGTEHVVVRLSPEMMRIVASTSSEAYDEVAKAALSFTESSFEYRGISLAEHGIFTTEGWAVARKKAPTSVMYDSAR